MEKACVPSTEEPGLRAMLIWPLRCSLCISAGNITTLSQLEPDIEIRISTAFNDSHSNPLVSIRKGHQHINRKVCYFNLQFFWVLMGAKENKLMPALPPNTCTQINYRRSRTAYVWSVNLCGSGSCAVSTERAQQLGREWQPAPVLVASVPSRFLEWTVVGTASTRASIALKRHRCTLLSHGITEAH